MRSGIIGLGSGFLRRAGRDGHYWTTTANYSTGDAYYLLFDPTDVSPSNHYVSVRYYGYSLRCLPCIRMAIVVAVKENEQSSFSLPTATPIQQE